MAARPLKDMTIRKVSPATKRRLKMAAAREDVKYGPALGIVTRLYELMANEVLVNGPEAAGASRWLEVARSTYAED